MNSRLNSRFPEIDLLRGLSVMAMVLYHGFWDLSYFDLVTWDIFPFDPQLTAKTIGSSFLLITGICLSISFSRSNKPNKLLVRGLKLLGWAAVISAVVYIGLDEYILFGILHLIGVSIILAPLFLPRPILAGLTGITVIATSNYLKQLPTAQAWLLPLGIGRTTMSMVDYYPLFPWFGVVLLGIWVGSICYPQGKRRFPVLALTRLNKLPGARFLRFLGRHSLKIYLVHQPIIYAALYCFANYR
ncbi:MAG: DUF1624 domain-containing protein [Firmicutes bacterium]|jgi:uncharacterized membrane protein|nr:DUF1624 domain-containing protein [Bacillota bacterium]